MPREIQREAFYRYRPTYAYSSLFSAHETPGLRTLCFGAVGGHSTGNQAWLRGAERFAEEFEKAALAAVNANHIKMYLTIDDPWKLAGYAREELSTGTFQAVWGQTRRVSTRTAADRINNVMNIVEHHGMMTPTQLDAAKWLNSGKFFGGRRFSSTWPSFIFGHYARAWSEEDLSWLVESQETPDEMLHAVWGLIGTGSGVYPLDNGLDFKLVRLVLEEGIAIEYVREVFL